MAPGWPPFSLRSPGSLATTVPCPGAGRGTEAWAALAPLQRLWQGHGSFVRAGPLTMGSRFPTRAWQTREPPPHSPCSNLSLPSPGMTGASLLPDFFLLINLSLVGPALPSRRAPDWQSLGGWSRVERGLYPRKWRLSPHHQGPQSPHC